MKNMDAISLSLLLTSMFLCQVTLAQEEKLRFGRLTVEDGLPNATVLSVLQDQTGFMWFATADGLSRYDGDTFTNYRHELNNPHSLSNNNTFTLIETRDGLLWIGTDPGGLNVFDPKTGQFSLYRHEPENPNSLINDSIWSLMEDRHGQVWIGTRGGLSRLDRETGQFTNYARDPDNPRSLADPVIYRLYEDQHGVVWLGTRNGLHRYDPATDDFTIYAHDPENPHSLSNSNVWAMLEDRQGGFWVGTRGGGLNRFDRQTETFTAYRHDPNDPASLSDDRIWALYENRAGHLWITTENGGLNRFDRQTATFTSFQHNPNDSLSLSHNDLFWMCEDRSGVFWITSRYGGVNTLTPALQRFGLYRHIPGDSNTLTVNNVYAVLAEDLDVLWIGTFGGGLHRLDRTTGRMQVFQHEPDRPDSLSHSKIYYIHQDEHGAIWASTSGGGLNRLDPDTGEISVYRNVSDSPKILSSNFLTTIKAAGPNLLWVGTLGLGLDLFDTSAGMKIKGYTHDPDNANSLSEDTIYDLAVEHSGRVWIATARGGLDLLDSETDTFTRHQHDPENPNSIVSNTVHAIYLDEAAGVVWAGTAEGLSRYDLTTRQWQNYTTRDGLSSATIMGVEAGNNGNLWISTTRGLSRFDMETATFHNYDVRDGLQGNQFNIASSHRGPDVELFFGGPNGLTFFRPEQMVENGYHAPVVFTDFLLFNQPVAIGNQFLPQPLQQLDTLTLPHNQSVFTFEFAALNYQLPSKNLYQYTLEGFDKDWSPPSPKRMATYTNLNPGHYTFMVRATNNDGLWNDTPTTLGIIILPPWWQTLWFRILAVVLGIGVIVGSVQWRFRSIQMHNRALEQRVRERTEDLSRAKEVAEGANRAKSTFLANMSHELRTPLNVILGFTQLMARNPNIPEKEHKNLSIIQRSGDHLLTLINQVLDLSKIEAGHISLNESHVDLYRLLDDLEDLFRFRAEQKHLGLVCERAPDVPRYIRTDEVKLRQVLINLLGNAVKFTQEGTVSLSVSEFHELNESKNSNIHQLKHSSTQKLQFSIQDTGPGIAPDELKGVFEAFVQTKTGRDAQEGTGLGLPISRKFVQLMGGDMTVSSDVGQGTLFTFVIQCEQLEGSGKWESAVSNRVVALEPGQPHYRLLIVDDQADNRTLLLELLSSVSSPRAGFELREAVNGQEAITQWATWHPHLIWMDLRMPVMGGYEAAQAIRRLENRYLTLAPGNSEISASSVEFPVSKIIALSASSLEEARSVAMSYGCDDFLRKPFRDHEIFAMLTTHLGVRFVYAEGGQQPTIRQAQTMEEVLTPQALAALPDDMRRELREAIDNLDTATIPDVLERIRQQHAPLAEALDTLVKAYRFDVLQTVFEKCEERKWKHQTEA